MYKFDLSLLCYYQNNFPFTIIVASAYFIFFYLIKRALWCEMSKESEFGPICDLEPMLNSSLVVGRGVVLEDKYDRYSPAVMSLSAQEALWAADLPS